MPRKPKSTRQAAIPVKYVQSDEIETAARKVMETDVALRSLREHNIGFFFVENRKDPGGRVDRWLSAKKSPPLWKDITEYEAVICVNAQKWGGLTDDEKRLALVHGLSHLSIDEKGNVVVEAHDVEAFAREVRHGGVGTLETTTVVEALTLFGKNGAKSDDEEDLRPKGEVNADALRGDAERDVVTDIDDRLRRRSRGNGQPPASLS